MKEYFKLQIRRFARELHALGINPIAGTMGAIAAFLFLSAVVFQKTAYPVAFYACLSVLSVSSLSGKGKNDFLKITFLRKKYQKIRLIENLLLVFPFAVFLLTKGHRVAAGITVVLAMALSLYHMKRGVLFTIPTPFSARPYEFLTGFRKTIGLIAGLYILSGIGIAYQNFNLGVFSLFGLFLLCTGFYSGRDPIFYVWIHAESPVQFLRKKLFTGIRYSFFGFEFFF